MLQQDFHDALVDACAHHELVVVERHEALNYLAHGKKRFLLGEDLEETSSDKVESLAVPNHRVPNRVRQAYALDLLHDFLPDLGLLVEVGLIGKGARKVQADLVQILGRVLVLQAFRKLQ